MNEESRWRYTLAQQIAPHYSANPKVADVAVEGSVARGYADRSSDLDLAVFWSEPPTAKERRDTFTRAEGRRGSLAPAQTAAGGRSAEFEVGGVTVDVRHLTVEATERHLSEVLSRGDSSLSKQQQLASLLSALPLSGPSVLAQWQSRAKGYPQALSVAMVREHLRFRPAWELEMLAERNDLLLLYDSLCSAQKYLLLVLLGLNHLYYPGWWWVDRLMAQLHLAPHHLAARFKELVGIVGIDPLASVYQLHDLVEEAFRLVETHLGEVDTMPARARFRAHRQVWGEHALLLRMAEQHARELMHDSRPGARVSLRGAVSTNNAQARSLFEREGYCSIREFWRVTLELADSSGEGASPLGKFAVDVEVEAGQLVGAAQIFDREGIYSVRQFVTYEKELRPAAEECDCPGDSAETLVGV